MKNTVSFHASHTCVTKTVLPTSFPPNAIQHDRLYLKLGFNLHMVYIYFRPLTSVSKEGC